jgi:hypothetical protein
MEMSGTPTQDVRSVFRVLGRWRADRVKDNKPGHGFSEQIWYELHPDAENMDLILATPLFVALR